MIAVGGTRAYHLDVRDVPEQTVGIIGGRVTLTELDPWIAQAIRELFTRFADNGVQPVGTPFSMLPVPDGIEQVDVEVALPANRQVPDSGRMTGRTIPACRALATTHVGPYLKLTEAYRLLALVMEDQGIEPSGEPREIYLTNPCVTPADELVTEVLWPIDVPAGWELQEPDVERPVPRTELSGWSLESTGKV